MTPDQSNPAMKYMPYIMPVFLLVFFNRLSSALTWYYTVSNLITLSLQFVIQHYIIDHGKILAQLQANRTEAQDEVQVAGAAGADAGGAEANPEEDTEEVGAGGHGAVCRCG